MTELNFQNWLMDNKPPENMLYNSSFWETYTFWRDYILVMFTDEFYKRNRNFDKLYKEVNTNSEIIGTHISKSIINPVVKIVYHGVTIVFRYNFYDYEIAVISEKKIYLPMVKLFQSQKESFYYQGFPLEFQIKERYENNKCKFIAGLDNHYKFYTFMYLLQRQIYLNSKREI